MSDNELERLSQRIRFSETEGGLILSPKKKESGELTKKFLDRRLYFKHLRKNFPKGSKDNPSRTILMKPNRAKMSEANQHPKKTNVNFLRQLISLRKIKLDPNKMKDMNSALGCLEITV
jgi:hypothetical protein